MSEKQAGEAFDYIVVGAGSAGCAVAARLSEDPSVRVLLLEAGPADRDFWIHLPIGYYRTIYNPKVSWGFKTEPDPGVNGRSIPWPRGKVLGGCSSINGLAYVRGQALDYDHWRQLGNVGWSYDDVLPFFKQSESFADGEDSYRGRSGPLHVSQPRARMELMDAFIEAAKQAGIPENPDYNGATQDGVAYFQLTIRNGLRCSAAKAYLAPAKGRPNLTIETDALTQRLLLDGRRVTGVAFSQRGVQRTARAGREVVLSAGAIGSPQILLLSGIGPAEELKAQGIGVAHDLPGVGKHLQDHYQARIVYRCPRPITLNDVSNSLWRRGLAGAEWALFRKGPLTVGAGVVALFWKTREELASPDVQFHVIPFSARGIGQPLHDFPGYTVSVCQLRPESRGELTLRDSDPASHPVIHANYLATEGDQRTMVDGMKLIRHVMGQPAIQPYIEAEAIPGPGCADDAALLDYVRGNGTTIFHPTSTCMMGPSADGGAVVDPRLRVHGLEGIRVADASIMPTVISGNTNAPSIMIGEKAAAMIAEDARARLAA